MHRNNVIEKIGLPQVKRNKRLKMVLIRLCADKDKVRGKSSYYLVLAAHQMLGKA